MFAKEFLCARLAEVLFQPLPEVRVVNCLVVTSL